MNKVISTAMCAFVIKSCPAFAAAIVNTGPQNVQPGGISAYVGSDTGIGGIFTTNSLYRISSLEYFGGGSGDVTASIRRNGTTPGDIIYSQVFNLQLPPQGWIGVAGIDFILDAGTYWITFETPRINSGALLYGIGFQNPLANEQLRMPTSMGGNWVPSQNGGGGSNFGFRINGDLAAISPIPEPITWAMMLGGFALVGGAMRVRRRRVVMAI